MKVDRFPFRTLIICMLLFASCDDQETKCCACMSANGTSDGYAYPVLPGTQEWSSLETGDEQYAACQIPDQVLTDMCPVGLVDSWLTYPLRIGIFMWPSLQIGFDMVEERFNGLQALLGSGDAADALVGKYEKMDPSGYPALATDFEKTAYARDLAILELTLAQYDVLEKLSSARRKELMAMALDKRIKKLNDDIYYHPDDVYGTTNPTDGYMVARIMVVEEYEPFLVELEGNHDLMGFLESCAYVYSGDHPDSPEQFDNYLKIFDHAGNYLNN